MTKRTRRTVAMGCVIALAAILAAGTTEAAPSGAVTLTANVSCSAYGYWGWGLPPATGTFGATGAITDAGQVMGPNTFHAGGTPPTPLLLTGASGSLTIALANGQWSVIGSTGAYAGLSGGGTATVTTTVHAWYGWILGYSYTYALTGSVS